MKIKRHLFMTTLVMALAAACTTAATSRTSPQKTAEKEWAFLIFMNGHNNLAEYTDLNLKQLETVGSTADVDVVVQWAKTGFDKTFRLKVLKSTDASKVTSPMVETLPRQDMGDYKTLVEFVRWAKEHYPAKRYFVSFWNHGSGWHRQAEMGPARDINSDDYSGNRMTTEQMGIALREIAAIIGHKVDIVGMDACLMAMAEVGSEIADSAEYMIASEELVPGLGWPYHWFYEKWAADPKASTAQIATHVVEEYHKYLGPNQDVTMSAFDLKQMPLLWEKFAALTTAITNASDESLIPFRAVTGSATKFSYADYVDIGSWLKFAQAHKDIAMDKDLLVSTADAVSKFVVSNKVTTKYADATGAAFWMPADKATFSTHAERYSKLRFGQETKWHEAVERLVSIPACKLAKGGQWANAVVGFSSEYSNGQWSAKQALGACDTASYGDHGSAWTPKETKDTEEFLTVSFATPVYAEGAIVRETYGNGFVTSVEAIDAAGKAEVVWQGKDTSATGSVIDFEVRWPKTSYLVKALKINITTTVNPGTYKEVDSVQLLGTP